MTEALGASLRDPALGLSAPEPASSLVPPGNDPLRGMSHDEAIDALCGCAATVTVLSYQEAIEGYFKLRDIPVPGVGQVPRDMIDHRLLRASISCQIGKECPFPTVKAAADHYGVHPEQLRMYVRGLRPPEPKLLAAFGVEPVTFYRPVPR